MKVLNSSGSKAWQRTNHVGMRRATRQMYATLKSHGFWPPTSNFQARLKEEIEKGIAKEKPFTS